MIDPLTLLEHQEYTSKYSTISQYVEKPKNSSSKKRGSAFNSSSHFLVDGEYSLSAPYYKPVYSTIDYLKLGSKPGNSNNRKNSVCPSPAALRFVRTQEFYNFVFRKLPYYALLTSGGLLSLLAIFKRKKVKGKRKKEMINKSYLAGAGASFIAWGLLRHFGLIQSGGTLRPVGVRY